MSAGFLVWLDGSKELQERKAIAGEGREFADLHAWLSRYRIAALDRDFTANRPFVKDATAFLRDHPWPGRSLYGTHELLLSTRHTQANNSLQTPTTNQHIAAVV